LVRRRGRGPLAGRGRRGCAEEREAGLAASGKSHDAERGPYSPHSSTLSTLYRPHISFPALTALAHHTSHSHSGIDAKRQIVRGICDIARKFVHNPRDLAHRVRLRLGETVVGGVEVVVGGVEVVVGGVEVVVNRVWVTVFFFSHDCAIAIWAVD